MSSISCRQELEEAIIAILHTGNTKYRAKSFYAHFIASMKRIYTSKVSTLGVNVTDQINLYINPEFFKSLSLQQRIEVLEHEVLHVVNYHMGRFENKSPTEHKLWNIACDAVINEPLTSLHEFGVTVEKLREMLEMPNLEKGKSSEYYYQAIKKFQKENPDKCQPVIDEFGDGMDDHSLWEESEQNNELAKQIINNGVKNAAEKAGNTPSEIELSLDRMNRSTVNWKNQLRRFFQRNAFMNREGTRKKRNRRYGIKVQGRKKKPHNHIAIGIDSSGSVWDEAFVQFFAELDKITDHVDMTIIECDAEVNKVYKYEKGMKIERHGNGGTYYSPAIKKAIELEVDGMIYFGDGDCFENEVTKPNFPMLWAMLENCNAPVNWGSKCEVKIQKK